MKYLYKSIPARGQGALRRAEMLRAHGWKLIRAGFYTLLFERPRFIPGSEAEKVYNEGRY